MQDRFVGDIGDFGKYALLNALCKGTRLGVVWYLIPDESHNADGKHVRYLNLSDGTLERLKMRKYTRKEHEKNERELQARDYELFEKLRSIVEDNARAVPEIRLRKVIADPSSTKFHEQELSFEGMQQKKRSEGRQSWLEDAYAQTKECDMIFLDPDNGLEVNSINPYTWQKKKKGPKYVTRSELKHFWEGGKRSIVLYQHFGFHASADYQLKDRARQIRRALRINEGMFAMRYHRGTARAFIVIPSAYHRKLLRSRAEKLMESDWGQQKHFSGPIDL